MFNYISKKRQSKYVEILTYPGVLFHKLTRLRRSRSYCKLHSPGSPMIMNLSGSDDMFNL